MSSDRPSDDGTAGLRRWADAVATPWRNGFGTTRDVKSVLAPDGSLLWQVSIADLVQDAPFSHYPHCDRIFTPIAGDPPPELAFHGGAFAPCPLLVPKHFSGEWPTLSRIPAPGRAFNVVFDRRHHAASVSVLHMAAGDPVVAPDAPDVVVHCLTGHITAKPGRLGVGDSLVGDGGGSIGTAGEPSVAIVVAIRVRPAEG